MVRRRPTAPGLTDLADRLSDRLETRVKVELGQRKGKITVEFASLDDLRRIVDVMDPAQPERPADLSGPYAHSSTSQVCRLIDAIYLSACR